MSRQASFRKVVSLRVRRFPSVLCFTMNRPSRVRPQYWVKAREAKVSGRRSPAPLTREGRKPAKLDQPRLVLMEHQAKAGQPRLEGREHLLRIRLAHEAHGEVVRIARPQRDHVRGDGAIGGPRDRGCSEDVGQERTDARPCGYPVRFLLLAALKNAGPQAQLYEPQDARIADPVRHHPQQRLVVDRVDASGHRLLITFDIPDSLTITPERHPRRPVADGAGSSSF
ncbi:hypothetical protein ACVWZ6_002739 [Bradyrhizobium sp. GM6.1]